MAEAHPLEAAVVQLRKENRELRSERENLLVKNRLLTDVLAKDRSTPEGKEHQNERQTHHGQVLGSSSSANHDADWKKAEREMVDLKEQVSQLKEAIERVRRQNESLENEKEDLMTEIDRAAERELALEDKLNIALEDKEGCLKELEDFKESLRALFPSSKGQSDLQGYLEFIEKREQENSDQEKYLDRRERLLDERINSLNLREAALRQREAELDEKIVRQKASKLNDPETYNYQDHSRPNGSKKSMEVDYNSQVDRRGNQSKQSSEALNNTRQSLVDSMAAGQESYFDMAKEKAKKKKEETDMGRGENRYMRVSESLSHIQGSGVSQQPSSHYNFANTLGRNNSGREKISQVDERHSRRWQKEIEEEQDPNKITFNPSKLSERGEFGAMPMSNSYHGRSIIDSKIDQSAFPVDDGASKSIAASSAKRKDNPFSNLEYQTEMGDANQPGQVKITNKWQKNHKSPEVYEAEKQDWDEHDNDDEMETVHREKSIDHQPNVSDFQAPPTLLQEQTIMESNVESQIKPATFNDPQASNLKKGVAFDLFDESIDEKKRQLLIQKLERNRAQDRHQFHKNNFLAEKRDLLKEEDKQKGEGLNSYLSQYEKQGNRSNISKAASGIVGNPSTQSKSYNRELSPNNDSKPDLAPKQSERRNPSTQGRRPIPDRPPTHGSPFIPSKK
jgi:hypothetical protein